MVEDPGRACDYQDRKPSTARIYLGMSLAHVQGSMGEPVWYNFQIGCTLTLNRRHTVTPGGKATIG